MQAAQAAQAGQCHCDVCNVEHRGMPRTTQHDDGTPYGYLGTADWRRAQEQAQEQRSAARVAALAGQARGEGLFADCAAPSGAGEHVEQRQPVDGVDYGSRVDWPLLPFGVRRYVAAQRRAGQAARQRQAVLAAARVREQARRRAQRARQPVTVDARPVLLTAVRPVELLTALWEHVAQREANSRAMALLMSREPNRDGRGTAALSWEAGTTNNQAADTVNGTEVRAAERWQSTPRSAILTVLDERHGVRCLGHVDWGCYRVEQDGSRTLLVATKRTKRKRTAAGKGTKRTAAAALLAAATTAGHVDAATA